MDASQLKKLSESYATIAEGGKHEKSAMDWNKKDDNPEGKKVDKKKVDKCTCESFYLKRLKAMNPVMAEKYLAIAEIFIEEGYESSRLIDNLVEALPKEVVGEDFRAALHAVNPRIYENLDTAEKRQARATLSEFNLMQKLDDLRRRAGNFLQGNPSGSGGITPEIRRAQEYRDKGGVGVPPELRTNTAPRINTDTTPKDTTPKDTTPNASNYSAADAQRDQEAAKAQAQAARTGGSGGPTRITVEPYSGSGSTAPARPTPTPAQTPITSRAAIAAGSKEGSGPKSAAHTYMAHGDKTKVGRYKTLAQHRAAVAANKAKTVSSSYEPEGELVDESLQKAVDNLTKKAQGGLEKMGVKINRTSRPTMTKQQHDAKIKSTQQEEVEAVDEGLKQARKNVGASTCWDGYKAKGTKKKNGKEVPNCVKEEDITEKKGLWDNIHAKRKRGEKPAKPGDKDYPKTLNVEGVMSKDKEDHDTGGFRISDKKAKEAKERVKEKTKKKRAEYDNRYSDNTGEESKKKKEALEKKRGMKLDDHPQFTRDDYNVYDIILTYLDENNLMESVEEAEEIMMQLTGSQIVEIIDEFMNMEDYKGMYQSPAPTHNRVTSSDPKATMSPGRRALERSDELQRTEPGSKRQRKQTKTSRQINRNFQSARNASGVSRTGGTRGGRGGGGFSSPDTATYGIGQFDPARHGGV